MMTDTPESVTLVPIDRIEVLNSRDRNMKVFEEIVENIRTIGLKKPITVACATAFIEAVRGAKPPPVPAEELFEVSRISIEVAEALR